MISKATFICILMFSLFSLHQCGQMDVGEIDSSTKFYVPKCVKRKCGFGAEIDCWCCHRDSSLCYYNVDDCVDDNNCPL
ncbi:hypothetical protein IGI04_005997 [Brassica rapa subsp. trilocularis]|uniref:BnaA02g13580D protein n=4 Tax=Brassica TaxID=3705 RepID=A0A078FE90_BRANA|nr:hypothetical protein IGI04_005997 [Brassica rapa subsp. trilocularis]KAH0938129.1 hypothetical protein HID58_005590 [Brassica napus]CAG7893043.1 unnamed protein product [Brassica rapa]CAF2138793.1 unnamed protein product [Brassica napus]CDY12690.1 BnaA02g13580D [Brassica napus]